MVNSKSFSNAFLTAMILSGLLLTSATRFGTVQASTGDSDMPTPSVPEFTLKFVDRSYDVPSNFTYEIDPYTGEEVRTGSAGYHVENRTIEITIKNQLFTPYIDANGHVISLYYNVTSKGHYGGDWRLYSGGYRKASNSIYTVLTLGLSDRLATYDLPQYGEVSDGSKIDFRVQAFIGYSTTVETVIPGWRPSYNEVYTGETSGWSEIQTIAIGESQTSTPFPTDYTGVGLTETEIIIGAIIAVAIIGFGLGLLLYLIKRK